MPSKHGSFDWEIPGTGPGGPTDSDSTAAPGSLLKPAPPQNPQSWPPRQNFTDEGCHDLTKVLVHLEGFFWGRGFGHQLPLWFPSRAPCPTIGKGIGGGLCFLASLASPFHPLSGLDLFVPRNKQIFEGKILPSNAPLKRHERFALFWKNLSP